MIQLRPDDKLFVVLHKRLADS